MGNSALFWPCPTGLPQTLSQMPFNKYNHNVKLFSESQIMTHALTMEHNFLKWDMLLSCITPKFLKDRPTTLECTRFGNHLL